MHLLSLNIGKEQPIQIGNKMDRTGIFKTPTMDIIQILPLGVEGDHVHDVENHGGVDQAVYIYGGTDYEWWATALGLPLAPGTFGENLTIAGLASAPIQIGDRLRVGSVLLEVTAPRIPCATLAARMNDPVFVKRFREAERPGLYCRVIEPGPVRAGDVVMLEPHTQPTITIGEMFRIHYDHTNEADLLRVLAAPIAIREREAHEHWLKALQS